MRLLCLFLLLNFNLSASAQEDEKIRDAIETIAENTAEDEDISEISERLTWLLKHPIHLNKTNPEELKTLFFLSSLQINNFFTYIATTKLLDVLELQAIPGFDVQTINNIIPFVTVSQQEDYKQLKTDDLIKAANQDIIFRYGNLLQQQKGFKDLTGSRYLGSSEKLLLRYKYNFRQIISAAVIIEKDAGEQIYQPKIGPDHMSAHLAVFKLGRVRKLVIGDYSLQFGQGLTLWSGFALGKGPDVTSVAAKDVGLKPYTSTNEASFFRGAANTINLGKNINLSTFFSYRKLDASLKILQDSSLGLSNINISGLHRTKTELKNQKSLKQQVYGSILQYLSDNLNIGIIGYYSHYEHAFVANIKTYERYNFTGKSLSNIGTHYNYTFKNIYFYGELGHSISSGMAMVNGAMASLSRKTSIVLLHRNYDKNYHNFFSKAVGEGTETNNESGLYVGLNHRLPANLNLSLYGDYFRFPWLKYRVNNPSSGYEFFSQLIYTKGKSIKVTLRFKRECKQQNPDSEDLYTGLQTVVKQNYRLEWNWKINLKFNFQQRTEISYYQKGKTNKEVGYMAYQDVNFEPLSSKFSGNLRIAFFNTPSYNSRIYAYEDNVLYAAGSGVYAGNGFRNYINTRYKLGKKIDIWGRYASYIYKQVKTIGTGLDEIEGNVKSEVKLQIRYQL